MEILPAACQLVRILRIGHILYVDGGILAYIGKQPE